MSFQATTPSNGNGQGVAGHFSDLNLRLHDNLVRHGKQEPDAIALEFAGEMMTYGELLEKSENIAFQLQVNGVKPNHTIAVIARRSLDLPVALFGILRSGAAYLPIDPDQPTERIRYLLEDSKTQLALTDLEVVLPSRFTGRQYLIEDLKNKKTEGRLEDRVSPHDLAYVIYTSGSTGKPKGAMIEHRSIVNRLMWMADQYQFTCADVQLQKTPITFDVSVHELFLWSLVGGRLALARPGVERDPSALLSTIEQHRVTHLHFVPSMLDVFLEYLSVIGKEKTLNSLRNVYCSGEALSPATVKLFFGSTGFLVGTCQAYRNETVWRI